MNRVSWLPACRCLVALLLASYVALGAPEPAAGDRTLKLQIIDANTKSPIQGAALKIHLAGCDIPDSKLETAADGTAAIPIPAAARYLHITVDQKPYVPMALTWGNANDLLKDLPGSYTLPLEPGTRISGKVLDDAGKPIQGASVVFALRNAPASAGQPRPARTNVSYKSVKTAVDGTWSYDRMPADISRIDLGVHHPEYPTDSGHAFYSMNEFKDVSKLRDGTATLTLKRGVLVRGVVLGPDGNPVKGAKVGIGRDRVASNVPPEISTADDGTFVFGALPGAEVPVTVKANGLAPELKTVTATGDKPSVEFRLQPGKTLRGRVLDSAGNPIPGATVYADTWRGARTLGNRFTTDKDGRFEWTGAPADAVQFDIMKSGYADARNTSLTAGDGEVTVKLNSPLKVRGTVVDAETGKPVEKFKVVEGLSFSADQPVYWQNRGDLQRVKPQPGGTFEYTQSYPYPGYAARIEADGYLPAESRVFTMNEREVTLEFKLTKGKSIAGAIRTPDGKPAVGAKLVLATPGNMAYLRNGSEVHDQGAPQTVTDNAGRYTFPPQSGPHLLIALNDAGYAEVPADDLAKSADVTLTPWGRVTGTALIGAKPAADAEIAVYLHDQHTDMKAPRVYHQIETKAGPDGRFALDRVKPGKASVARVVRITHPGGGWMSGSAQSATVNVQPGRVSTVTLGGTGRPIVGRVLIPQEVASLPQWFFAHSQLMTKASYPKLERPDNFAAMTTEEKKKWHEDFMKSDAGKAYTAAVTKAQDQTRAYTLAVNRDGSFRADDIPAGTYTLNIQVSKPRPDSSCGPGDTVATASTEIIVPDMPTGRSDDPLDIGTLPLLIRKTVNVGDPAPDFAVKTLDDKPLKLSDYRGKYVLLDFWATWCGPCVAETPHLKEAYEAFSPRDNFAMIALSLDESPKDPKAYVEKNGIKWTQGFLGDWSKATLPSQYGVNGIPSLWLIGPDGKVLAKDLRGPNIKSTLAQHLKGDK